MCVCVYYIQDYIIYMSVSIIYIYIYICVGTSKREKYVPRFSPDWSEFKTINSCTVVGYRFSPQSVSSKPCNNAHRLSSHFFLPIRSIVSIFPLAPFNFKPLAIVLRTRRQTRLHVYTFYPIRRMFLAVA